MDRKNYKKVLPLIIGLFVIAFSWYLMSRITYKKDLPEDEVFAFSKNLASGINIGNTLDCYSSKDLESVEEFETYWHNPQISDEFVELVRKSGFNTVKIPVTWDEHFIDEQNTISDEWMSRVKEVVDYAYSKNMYVIVDAHHDKWFSTSYENEENALKTAEKVWRQIAEAFADYDEHVIFEGFNEPRIAFDDHSDISGNNEAYDVINKLNQKFIDTVRICGGKNKNRYLIISDYMNSPDDALNKIVIPDDDRIMVSVHLYSPYSFTGNNSKNGTDHWSKDDKELVKLLDFSLSSIERFVKKNKVPVIVTEMGAAYKNNDSSRYEWTKYATDRLKKMNIPYIWWDDNYSEHEKNGYAIFDRFNLNVVYPDILDVLKAESSQRSR